MNLFNSWRTRRAVKAQAEVLSKELGEVSHRCWLAHTENTDAEAHLEGLYSRVRKLSEHYARNARVDYPLFESLLVRTCDGFEVPGRLFFRSDDTSAADELLDVDLDARDLFNETVDLLIRVEPALFDALLRVEMADLTLSSVRASRRDLEHQIGALTAALN